VAMLKSSLEVETDSLPDWVQQLNELSRRQLQGSLAYINAEIAASRQNWGQAEQQLDEADEEWTRTVEQAVALGIPQGRQLAETTRATSTQVIGAFRRRIIRERQLYAEMAKLENSIKDLETVNDRLHKEILEMAKLPRIASTQGEITMNDKKIARGHIVSGGNAQGHVVSGGRVEGDLTYAGNDVVYGHKTTEMDFSQIWQQHASEIDLAELAKELDALLPRLESSGGGEHDTEIGAVAVAQKAAAQNDGPKTLKWLKTAGKWVLEAAKDIAPIVVKVLDIVL